MLENLGKKVVNFVSGMGLTPQKPVRDPDSQVDTAATLSAIHCPLAVSAAFAESYTQALSFMQKNLSRRRHATLASPDQRVNLELSVHSDKLAQIAYPGHHLNTEVQIPYREQEDPPFSQRQVRIITSIAASDKPEHQPLFGSKLITMLPGSGQFSAYDLEVDIESLPEKSALQLHALAHAALVEAAPSINSAEDYARFTHELNEMVQRSGIMAGSSIELTSPSASA